MEVNGMAPGILAEMARRLDTLLVHYSTDYVFDGAKRTPYTEDDLPNPLNVYGRTKLAGERAIQATGCRHLIFRTSWVYSERGSNFLLTILRLARERGQLRIVSDQIGAPTSAAMIARATAEVIGKAIADPEIGGLYHMTARGQATWYQFARAIVERAPPRVEIEPILSEDYPSATKRPKYSIMDNSKLHAMGVVLPSWEDGLNEVARVMRL